MVRVPRIVKLLAASLVAGVALIGCGSSSGTAASTSRVTPAQAAAAKHAVPAHVADGDWTRFDYNAVRSGVGPAQTGITASDLAALKRRTVTIDGVADTSPVQLHGIKVHGRRRDVAFVTTTYGHTIAFDPATGQKLWEYTPRDISSLQGTQQITTASPVLDPDRRFLYAATPDGYIHKLSVTTGRESRAGHWPARITDDAQREKIGGALNVSGRDVLAVTGGYIGDQPVYQGHVVAINRSSGRLDHVWNALCSNRHGLIDPPSSCPVSDAAIWARAGAVVVPGSGDVLVATGNAPWNGSTQWGDSVLELGPDASGLRQNFTPTNQAQLNHDDTDLGSTAPAVLPPFDGRHLAVQGGKGDVLYLLDLDRLNGTAHAGPRLGGELQQIAAPGGAEVFSAPAVWQSGGRTFVFVADGSGTSAYVLGGDGRTPRLSVAWTASTPGTSPVLAGGLLYVYDEVDGVLTVRNPTSGAQLAALPAARGHWNSPIVIGGRIILPVGGSSVDRDTSGQIFIYSVPRR